MNRFVRHRSIVPGPSCSRVDKTQGSLGHACSSRLISAKKCWLLPLPISAQVQYLLLKVMSPNNELKMHLNRLHILMWSQVVNGQLTTTMKKRRSCPLCSGTCRNGCGEGNPHNLGKRYGTRRTPQSRAFSVCFGSRSSDEHPGLNSVPPMSSPIYRQQPNLVLDVRKSWHGSGTWTRCSWEASDGLLSTMSRFTKVWYCTLLKLVGCRTFSKEGRLCSHLIKRSFIMGLKVDFSNRKAVCLTRQFSERVCVVSWPKKYKGRNSWPTPSGYGAEVLPPTCGMLVVR